MKKEDIGLSMVMSLAYMGILIGIFDAFLKCPATGLLMVGILIFLTIAGYLMMS